MKPRNLLPYMRVVMSFVAIVMSLILAFVPCAFWHPANVNDSCTWIRGGVLAAWSIVPPLWFLGEYQVFKTSTPPPNENAIADFKYLQDLSAKCWAGMLAGLTVLYFGKDIFHW